MAKYSDDELDDGEGLDYGSDYDDDEFDDEFSHPDSEVDEILESLVEDLSDLQIEDLYRKLGDHIIAGK